ncbi:MAG: YggS family pyridoxal phosphate-dependent enzyme [Phycisphaerales bacterium]|jgi:pyridoxal phosphate enzyme (YggS family)|nr:YggS family pyridoxal phosphate-dependent enzyme [Phycisphaerales bacterium]
MNAVSTLAERYGEVRERVAAAAARSGRTAEDVFLVAVSKAADPEDIRALIDMGHVDFGENRVMQMVQRAAMFEEYAARARTYAKRSIRDSILALDAARSGRAGDAPPALRWHLIGHLQRNKARKAIEVARLIHSVDSLRLAEELQMLALKRDATVEVLVQVNCSNEPQKYGCPVPAAGALCEQIDTMVNVRVRGLMTMAAIGDTPEQARPVFARCRELFEEIRKTGVSEGRFNLLSMGMSGDYEVAIEEGANIVRVGSAIFGVPSGPDVEEEDEE